MADATMNLDMMKMFTDFRIPGMPDMDTLAAAQRKNIEALTAANRIALEGAQAVARRHMEILQSSLSEMTDAMKTMSGQESPQAKAARQTEMMKSSYEKAVANMRELAELIQKSNTEALGLLNHRFTEAMDEVKTMVAKPA
jgi:phasin family protein